MSSVMNSRRVAPGGKPIVYPTSDGRPMGETDFHRNLMIHAIQLLMRYYAGQRVYVSGNILLYYEEGNKHKHLSPDVLVAKGIAHYERDYYLLWDEGVAPQFVIEVTSASTRKEDLNKKFKLYRDVIGVREYFLFDPLGEYLKPSLQGYRLRAGEYRPITPLHGRFPSKETGLHLERVGNQLRFYNPTTKSYLPTAAELEVEMDEKLEEKDTVIQEKDTKLAQSAEEIARLRRELEKLRTLKGGQ